LGDVLKFRTASTLCPHHANLIVLFFSTITAAAFAFMI